MMFSPEIVGQKILKNTHICKTKKAMKLISISNSSLTMQKCDKLAMRAQDKGYTHLFIE